MSHPQGQKVGTGQGTGTQRRVKSTRTPITRATKDSEPQQHAHRSQTLPPPVAVSSSRRTPTPQMTMPTPSTNTSVRQRTPSFPKPQSKRTPSPLPEPSTRKSSLDGTGYIVEPLHPSFRSESREGKREPQAQLPPATSIPAPKPTLDSTRQSVSSFQTEPSSYYSAPEDGGPDVGTPIPPPQMPQPSHAEQDPQFSRYEALWLASQAAEAPPMPVPEVASPPMPSAHIKYEPSLEDDYSEDEGDFEAEYQEDVDQRGIDDYEDTRAKEDHSQFTRTTRPAPGMPVPTFGSAPASSSSKPQSMPVPSTGREYEAKPIHGSTLANYPPTNHGTTPESSPPATISSTAPLRIHHTPRPSVGVGSPSSNLTSPHPSAVTPSNQFNGQNTPISSHSNNQHQPQKPPVTTESSVSGVSKQHHERPSVTPSTTTTPSQSQHGHKRSLSYEERPPGASAPNIPSGGASSIYNNPPPSRQYTSQNNTVRPGKSQATSGPPSSTGHTSSLSSPPTHSASSSHTRPTAATPPSHPSPSPSKPTPTPSSVTPSYQNTKPVVSSNLAPARPQQNVANNHNQQTSSMTTARPSPQALESTRPSISSPQVQHQSSTGSAAPSRPQVKIQEPAPPTAAPSHPTRQRLSQTFSQMDTQYVNMLLALDDIPTLHNLLAGFFNWILLAGFILFPGTFTSLQNLNATGVTAQVQHQLVNAVTHIPLFVIAWVCTGIGGIGMVWMSWRWRKNYLWGLNKIFMPGFLNSLAGLLSTLVNIFGVQHGQLSTTSKITLIVTSASTGVLGILTAFYTLWLVRRVKNKHDEQVGKEKAGQHGEGVVDLSKRRANGGR